MNYPKLVWQIPPIGDFVCPDGVDMFDYLFFTGHRQDGDCGDCDGVDLAGMRMLTFLDLVRLANDWQIEQ